jgi:hypothetical protein
MLRSDLLLAGWKGTSAVRSAGGAGSEARRWITVVPGRLVLVFNSRSDEPIFGSNF